MMPQNHLKAVVYQHGKHWPKPGDYVRDNDDVYRVVSIDSPIETGRVPGESYHVYATVARADWSAVAEQDEPECRCEILRDEGA
jgi:hypothetical protein